MIRRRNVWATSLLIAGTTLLATGVSHATPDPEKRCTRAATAVRSRILRTDTRLLARCAIAVRFAKPAGETEEICSRLRTRGEGADLIDARGRDRLLNRCAHARPQWLNDRCPGPGSWTGLNTIDVHEFANCMTSTAHCFARNAVEPLVGPLKDSLGIQHPGNLEFEFGTQPGNSFAACTTASTTTTLPVATTSTTTTTMQSDPEPATTTTLADPEPTTTTTTTVTDPEPTTTTTTISDPEPTTTSTTVPAPGPVSWVITEFMSNPAATSDTVGEYFEIKNTGTAVANLQGATFRDAGSNSFTVQDPLNVSANGYAVLAKTESAAGGHVDYVYGSGMALSNSADEIILEIGGEIVDVVAYDGTFPLESGIAAELSPNAETAAGNDSGANWCAAVADLGDGDLGSPGASAGGCSP